ncbi:aldose 1-epimerase [Sulfitobacter sp. D35]|uniref:aldose 1-epimerase n=1 Tax=Sulfitobacter sp. D35 TaxID=3083252 RepID=UPI00296F566B|nr:aldose 1-epimerase [Sulfitobacter sp. D35]MDW4499369.1 aldose 1-epimerase [Sulfitobacter sp. D35]
MARLLELSDGRSRVSLAPGMGGGIARFDALTSGGPVPVLRAWDGSAAPFALACNVLAPFSNRVSGGGFTFEGVFHPLPCNLDGEGFPIHGDAFQRVWAVEQEAPTHAVLTLTSAGIGPFRYDARLDYRLDAGSLGTTLTITNSGPRLPFGGGFHPWFPRRASTRLCFAAEGAWLEDDRHLPTAHRSLAELPQWNFSDPQPLPDTWINNAFTGWSGTARIDQPDLGLAVEIVTDGLDTAIVYAPSPEAAFFCFEPVSHAVDAANQPGQPGLIPLETGQSLVLSMSIGWR